MTNKLEIAKSVKTGNYMTNYHDEGEGFPLLLIHGSGPGVTAWANWRLVIPKLSKSRRVIAPDMVGFGYTGRPEGIEYNMKTWAKQTVDFLDALGIEQADIVGNSFGGALALAMAIDYPDRIRKVVLMGAVGIESPITVGLDMAWGYEPSLENMGRMLKLFVSDTNLITEDLIKMRYEASIQPGFQEAFSMMFPAPRQQCLNAMARTEEEISNIKKPTLIIHGREDAVIPLENAYKFINLIDNAQLHVFGHCGHWTQIEQTDKFVKIVEDFLSV